MGDGFEARTQPHSAEAEQAVIGCVLLDNEQHDAVAAVIEPDDFHLPMHRGIWSTVREMVAASMLADVLTVAERGGHELKYLNALAESVVSPRHAAAYAKIVRACAVRRHVMRIGLDMADDAMRDAGGGVSSVIQAAVAELLALEAGDHAKVPRPVGHIVPEFLDRLERRAEGEDDAISTGLRDLDRKLGGGLRPTELFVVGARPSMGKSSFSLTVARGMARRGAVLVCSMEDSEQMIVARQIAAAGRVNLAHLRRPADAPNSMWDGVLAGSEALQDLNLWIDEQPALKLADVKRKIAYVKQRAKHPLVAVIVDYIQLMDGDGDNRHQELSLIAAGLKAAAKEYGVCIILLSQLNREADKLNGPPRLEHLRESGGIEEAADIVGLLWREHRRKPTPENKHTAQIELAKHKNGATDTVRLWFDGATQRFCDWSTEADDAYR